MTRNRYPAQTLSLGAAAGGLAGALLLHPLAMAFLPDGSVGGASRWLAATVGTFRPAMWPMVAAFAITGGVLFAITAAVTERSKRSVARRPRREPPLRRMCMTCKAIPQDAPGGQEVWLPLEQSLFQTDHMVFSHGLCPRCKDSFLEEIEQHRRTRRNRSAARDPEETP